MAAAMTALMVVMASEAATMSALAVVAMTASVGLPMLLQDTWMHVTQHGSPKLWASWVSWSFWVPWTV